MKPVVSALNAWSWYGLLSPTATTLLTVFARSVVVSVFAIVILSIIGGLFKVRHFYALPFLTASNQALTQYLQ